MEQELTERIGCIRRQLEDAAMERWGRAPEIIAVSKTVPAPRVNEVKNAGIRRLGENRVQEILEKRPYLDASFQIDLIGRLQLNKVKYIIDKVAMIQSLDREANVVEELVAALPGLEVRGLMAIMPDLGDEAALRPYFMRMRQLFDALREEALAGVRMQELSMGMSGDYLPAAQEGATHVRIGSAIFGRRSTAAPQKNLKGEHA